MIKTHMIRIRFSTLKRLKKMYPPIKDESLRAYFDRVVAILHAENTYHIPVEGVKLK